MSSKTKIVVLHMKELIYTGLFALLAILFIVLLIIMFLPDKKEETVQTGNTYIPGVYTSALMLGSNAVEIELTVDENNISSIQLNHLDEAITTMYPLIEPSFEDLANQICEKQSLENITFSNDTKYTSTVLLDAIRNLLKKAMATPDSLQEPTVH